MSRKVEEEWGRLIARSSIPPYWLSTPAPSNDVCLSSRARIMRNLAGHRFPHHAEFAELRTICDEVLAAADRSRFTEILRGLGPADRDALVATRLISPEFPTDHAARAVLLDSARMCSVMVNEEDHLRIQAITPGWSIDQAIRAADATCSHFESSLEFAHSPKFGYLSASPFNCGDGVRLSSMFHLIALATSKRLPKVLNALNLMQVVVRGLFGESSKGIGAYLQVSVGSGDVARFKGACEMLIQEERVERKTVGKDVLESRAQEAVTVGIASRVLSLADALRILGWVRWGATEGLAKFPESPRIVDGWLAMLELHPGTEESRAARDRAVLIRTWMESSGKPGKIT